MSWTSQTLDQLGYLSRGRSRHRPRDAVHLYGGPYPFIQTGDVKHAGLYVRDYQQTYSEAGLQQSRLWPAGTLCITIAANIADTAILGIDACFPDSVIGFIPDEKKADARFVKYLFDATIQQRVKQFTQGAAQDNLSQEKLLSIDFSVPNVDEQKRIASILSAYDDLIENNRRRIQLLEQAARLLYKEWFVHLRFPGHEHVKIKDGVPEGWEKKSFSDIATFLNGFAFKPSHLGELGLPIVKIPELRDGPTAKTPRNTGDRVPEKYLLESGDILFSWSGTLLVNTWNHGKALLNQHLFKVTPGVPNLRSLVYLSLNSALAEFQSQTVGSTMKHIRKDALEKVLVFVPSKVLLDEFESVAAPVLEQVSILQKQNSGLAKVRDLLLQRLMNGNLVI
ncbi:Type I restriction-modification system specificity subunit [Acidithiobacillus ferrivorans]|uniref:Type I restriction-modification system specificity subunit n=1 Tax=Acidithiobacillus ferrivorans TaxID=160808 RepID=A0A060UM33_9PROT|nr:restriction endonuclease subunit S [Acidithiobacillus ferrivorans]CDQ09490.1 Type I restriction-modification system specificity subunit [Acidithiobacillus ferrivorans]SMH67262.1 Type I restriction-modification system specificity subunit [Acidithiobacillus ferrivorans]